MDIAVKYGRDMKEEEFNALLALDIKVYGEGIIAAGGMALKRFLKFKDGIISAYSGGFPAGFICFYNVDRTVYERAAAGEFIDDNLCDSEIRPFAKNRENNILLFDYVVDEPFRNRGLGKMLAGLAGDFLRQKNDKGYSISRIFGYAITEKGVRGLQSYGGRESWSRDGVAFFEVNKEAYMRMR